MESLTLYLFASLVVIATPGPDLIYVLTRGMADGKRSGVISAVGVASGLVIHTMAAALGLAVLLKASPYAFWLLKIGGGIYLIYLGIQMIRHKEAFELSGPPRSASLKKAYIQGLISNVVNPKIALFFVAFLPQFVSPDNAHHSLYMMILGLIFAFMTVVLYMILGMSAGQVGAWIMKRRNMAGKIRIGAGSVLMLLGLRLVAPQR